MLHEQHFDTVARQQADRLAERDALSLQRSNIACDLALDFGPDQASAVPTVQQHAAMVGAQRGQQQLVQILERTPGSVRARGVRGRGGHVRHAPGCARRWPIHNRSCRPRYAPGRAELLRPAAFRLRRADEGRFHRGWRSRLRPAGWPFDSRPPETLTGRRPPRAVSPLSISAPLSPKPHRPRFS